MLRGIGLYGGSFDPVHTGHLISASVIREEFGLEKIYFIPNYLSPYKILNDVTDADHRVEMLKMATFDNDCFAVSEFESQQNRAVYTYETVDFFKKTHPDKKLYLIIGYDCYLTLAKWKKYQHFKDDCQIIVARRPGGSSKIEKKHEVNFSRECPLIDISSTMVRKRVAENLDIKYLVNEKVKCYITNKGLYKTK
ncbi:MAG: nicotinate-nucleotide adenylyltransferase [Candidatus Delongbacteria bacterium]